MYIDTPSYPEVGRARVIYAPDLELSLPEAQELVSALEALAGVRGLTVTWRADHASPDVLVRAAPRHLRRATAKLVKVLQLSGGSVPHGHTAAAGAIRRLRKLRADGDAEITTASRFRPSRSDPVRE